MTSVVDWRTAPASDVVPLVDAEARAWLDELHWDVADAWKVVEPARLAGHLPGAIARDTGGRPVGWTAYLRHGASVQVMALVAPDEEATRALLEAILTSDEAETADIAIVCVRDASPGLTGALQAQGFDIEPYRYLSAPLDRFQPTADTFDPWPASDDEVARLFLRAYADETTVRAFAPTGSLGEWVEYLGQLRKGPGCGWFQPELCRSARRDGTDALDAGILVTRLGPGTIHIAQVAVDPDVRRHGLARRMVTAVLGRAAVRHKRATLLVSASNAAAGALYGSLGFTDVARFVVATRRSAPEQLRTEN